MNVRALFRAGFVLTACSAAAAAAAPTIATVSAIDGKVLVNSGYGFVPAMDSLALKAGDKVMVGKGAFAKIRYQSCTLSLSQSSVFVVTPTAPCEQPVVPVADMPGAGGAPAGGAGGAGAGAGAGGVPGAALPSIGGLPPIVTTLAFVGPAAVACAVKCDDWFGDDPVSGN